MTQKNTSKQLMGITLTTDSLLLFPLRSPQDVKITYTITAGDSGQLLASFTLPASKKVSIMSVESSAKNPTLEKQTSK